MEHALYPSLEAMLVPDAFGAIEGTPVVELRRLPFSSVDSLSGSRFLRLETVSARDGTRHGYIVKRISLEWDWLMRAAGDQIGRAALAWQSGLLDRVPAVIDHGVVACAEDGSGRAILMRDLRDCLFPPGDERIAAGDHERILDAMAELHARFWDDAADAAPERGFISLRQHYHILSPETARREAGGSDPIPRMIGAGWELLPELVDPDIAAVIGTLLDDPGPLCTTLAPHSRTVVQGDWKLGNLGLRRGWPHRVVLLDWDRVGSGPPGLDLAWYLAVNSARLPVSKEDTIASYRGRLERRLGGRLDPAEWQRQLDLTLLGGFLQLGWPKLLGAVSEDPATRARERAELRWWSDRVRAGARWL